MAENQLHLTADLFNADRSHAACLMESRLESGPKFLVSDFARVAYAMTQEEIRQLWRSEIYDPSDRVFYVRGTALRTPSASSHG